MSTKIAKLFLLAAMLIPVVADAQEPVPDTGSDTASIQAFEGPAFLMMAPTAAENQVNSMIYEAITSRIKRGRVGRRFRSGERARLLRKMNRRDDFEDAKWEIIDELHTNGMSADDIQDPEKLRKGLEDFDWQNFFENFLKPLLELIKSLFLSGEISIDQYVAMRDVLMEVGELCTG